MCIHVCINGIGVIWKVNTDKYRQYMMVTPLRHLAIAPLNDGMLQFGQLKAASWANSTSVKPAYRPIRRVSKSI